MLSPSKVKIPVIPEVTGDILINAVEDWCAQCRPVEASTYFAEKLERAAMVLRDKAIEHGGGKRGWVTPNPVDHNCGR